MATPRLGLVVEDKPTELSCMSFQGRFSFLLTWLQSTNMKGSVVSFLFWEGGFA